MKHKNARLIIVVVTAFTLFTTGCSISETRSFYSTKPMISTNTDSTSYVSKLDIPTHKPNDEQK